MTLACSLYKHRQAYQLSTTDALLSPVLSPYAMRHLDLANKTNTPFVQKWGHRIIAAIQFIPVVGMLACLIERIVALACHAIVKRRENEICKAQAQILGIRIPAGEKPREYLNKYVKAKHLLDFCRQIPHCNIFIMDMMHDFTNDIELINDPIQIAEDLRKWMAQDATTAQLLDLSLSFCNLKTIPPEIKYFKNLQELSLDCNQISSLPPEIGDLVNLRRLNLNNNQLESLPSEIGNLVNLVRLVSTKNQLKSLPHEIGNLIKLCWLNVSDNQLTALPASANRLNLRQLKIDSRVSLPTGFNASTLIIKV